MPVHNQGLSDETLRDNDRTFVGGIRRIGVLRLCVFAVTCVNSLVPSRPVSRTLDENKHLGADMSFTVSVVVFLLSVVSSN